jgi:hypothetical protein
MTTSLSRQTARQLPWKGKAVGSFHPRPLTTFSRQTPRQDTLSPRSPAAFPSSCPSWPSWKKQETPLRPGHFLLSKSGHACRVHILSSVHARHHPARLSVAITPINPLSHIARSRAAARSLAPLGSPVAPLVTRDPIHPWRTPAFAIPHDATKHRLVALPPIWSHPLSVQ